jgi:hypothetical protein
MPHPAVNAMDLQAWGERFVAIFVFNDSIEDENGCD